MRYSDTGFTTPSVPALLRAARKAAGLTQTQVAARMGTTQSAVSRAEALDGPDPTIAFLERFAVATGQPLTVVVRPARQCPPQQAAAEVLASGKRLRVLARRVGCAWISVVDPSSRHAPPPSEADRLQLVVRLTGGPRRDHAVERLRRAAERTFCRAVSVADLDGVRPPRLRHQMSRSRRPFSPALINRPCPSTTAPRRIDNPGVPP